MTIWNRDTIPLIPALIMLFALVLALPSHGHAQNRSAPYRVYDAENLGWLTKVKWGLQWVFIPAALNDIVPFYSYNLREICSSLEQIPSNQSQGQVADSGDAAENEDWGAVLYKDVATAFDDFIGPFALSHNVKCPSAQDLSLEHAAIIGNWHFITTIREGSDASAGEGHDLFLATTRPLPTDALPSPSPSPRLFVGENYNIGSFLGNEALSSPQAAD